MPFTCARKIWSWMFYYFSFFCLWMIAFHHVSLKGSAVIFGKNPRANVAQRSKALQWKCFTSRSCWFLSFTMSLERNQVYYSQVGCCDWSSLRHFLLPLKLAGCPALQLPAEMLDMLLWCIRFSYCWPHAEWYRSALRDLYLHGLPGDYLSLSQSPANFLTCRARILLGQWVSFGFQASCKIHQTFSCLHSFSAAIISYTVHFSQTLDVWNLVKAEDGVKCEWTASVSLGSLALFPRCCTVDLLCVGFTVFFFFCFVFEGEVTFATILWWLFEL